MSVSPHVQPPSAESNLPSNLFDTVDADTRSQTIVTIPHPIPNHLLNNLNWQNHQQQFNDAMSFIVNARWCQNVFAFSTCVRIEQMSYILTRLLGLPVIQHNEIIRTWLTAVFESESQAKTYMNDWNRSRRIYTSLEDNCWWQRLLDDSKGCSKSFSMSTAKFLHDEYDTIAAVWVTDEQRHHLWNQVFISKDQYSLPSITYFIGCQILQSRGKASSACSDEIFRTMAAQVNYKKIQSKLSEQSHPMDESDDHRDGDSVDESESKSSSMSQSSMEQSQPQIQGVQSRKKNIGGKGRFNE